jgi:hypothetical protein
VLIGIYCRKSLLLYCILNRARAMTRPHCCLHGTHPHATRLCGGEPRLLLSPQTRSTGNYASSYLAGSCRASGVMTEQNSGAVQTRNPWSRHALGSGAQAGSSQQRRPHRALAASACHHPLQYCSCHIQSGDRWYVGTGPGVVQSFTSQIILHV